MRRAMKKVPGTDAAKEGPAQIVHHALVFVRVWDLGLRS